MAHWHVGALSGVERLHCGHFRPCSVQRGSGVPDRAAETAQWPVPTFESMLMVAFSTMLATTTMHTGLRRSSWWSSWWKWSPAGRKQHSLARFGCARTPRRVAVAVYQVWPPAELMRVRDVPGTADAHFAHLVPGPPAFDDGFFSEWVHEWVT